MLVFVDADLVLFAVPKTGSTAYHLALRGKADISLANKAFLKHMNLRKYERDFAPYLSRAHGLAPERAAVIRDPLEYLRSWYRYRQAPKRRGAATATTEISFDDFVMASLADDPPAFARVGTQFGFVTDAGGAVRVHHLFAYESPLVLRRFLQERLSTPIDPKERNVSPPAPTPISPGVEAALRRARADDFALHDAITAAGGHLVTQIDG